MKTVLLGLCLLVGMTALAAESVEKKLVLPTQEHLEWADAELGVLIHFDLPVFKPGYQWRQWGSHPDASIFNPTQLDTDQWMKVAKSMGARYAVLVAKHCSGFSLWPTKAHDYNISKTPYKNGKGDIVKEFIASCKKYGIRPGIYASTTANGFLHVDNPGLVQKGAPVTQQEYNHIVETQLTELWSNYGKLFEIWFDGGVLAKKNGGANVLELAQKYQPQAIAFQGPAGHPHLIRWVGNERGTAPYPCWSTTGQVTKSDGVKEQVNGMNGHPDASLWCPGESDCTLRYNHTFQGGWFWHAGQDGQIFSVDQLLEKYVTSVGRNTNMLLGLVIDNRGLIPEGDAKRVAEFGAAIRKRFGSPLKTTRGEGKTFELAFDQPIETDRVILQEEIAFGERVLAYNVKGLVDGVWKSLTRGTCIGHKRIAEFKSTKVNAIKLEITSCKAMPKIRNFAVFTKE